MGTTYSGLSTYFYGSKEANLPKPTIQDAMVQMMIQSKQIQKQSEHAMKQFKRYMKRAKEELQKNNQESAKLYLASAASKKQQSINMQRMAMKMQFLAGNMKNVQNNQQIMNSFGKMAQTVSSTVGPNFENISSNIAKFENTMDQMMINGKLLEQMMSQKETGVDSTVQNMFQALKNQMAMETENNLDQATIGKQKKKQLEQSKA